MHFSLLCRFHIRLYSEYSSTGYASLPSRCSEFPLLLDCLLLQASPDPWGCSRMCPDVWHPEPLGRYTIWNPSDFNVRDRTFWLVILSSTRSIGQPVFPSSQPDLLRWLSFVFEVAYRALSYVYLVLSSRVARPLSSSAWVNEGLPSLLSNKGDYT